MCVFVLQSRVRLPQETDCPIPGDMVMLDQNSDTNRVMGVEAKVRTEQEAQGDSPFTVRTLQHTLRAPVAVASQEPQVNSYISIANLNISSSQPWPGSIEHARRYISATWSRPLAKQTMPRG